jgi:hypothetical protein
VSRASNRFGLGVVDGWDPDPARSMEIIDVLANEKATAADLKYLAQVARKVLCMEKPSVDVALGLVGRPGKRSWRTRQQYATRNRLLAEAVDRIRICANKSIAWWPAAEVLADRLREFHTREWPQWRHLEQPPATATPVQRELDAIFRANPGQPPPLTQGGIYEVITQASD